MICASLAITVMFSQVVYSVNEDTGVTEAVLVLSNVSSTGITVEVFNTDKSSTGEYYSTLMLIMV